MKKDRRKEVEQLYKTAKIHKLVTITKAFESELRVTMVDAMSGTLSNTKINKVMSEVNTVTKKYNTETNKWIKDGIDTAYVEGMKRTDKIVKTEGLAIPSKDITVRVLYAGAEDMLPHQQATKLLLTDAYLDFGRSMRGVTEKSKRTLNETLRRQVRTKLAQGRLAGDDIRSIAKEVKKLAYEKGYTVLLDKGGRTWTLENYSKMLARTHLLRANNEATINRALDYDIDIVQISAHGAEDDVCSKYENKIYSLSGKSKTYEKLPTEPPFHPNCKHSILLRPDINDRGKADYEKNANASLDKVYRKADKAKKEIDALADSIASKYNEAVVAKAPIKGRKRALEKVLGEYNGDARRLGDLARNTIVVKNDRDLRKVYAELSKHKSVVKSKLIKSGDDVLGYTGANFKLKTSNGLLAEIQLNTPEMIYAKEKVSDATSILGKEKYKEIKKRMPVKGGLGHTYYEEWRSSKTASVQTSIEKKSVPYYQTIRDNSK